VRSTGKTNAGDDERNEDDLGGERPRKPDEDPAADSHDSAHSDSCRWMRCLIRAPRWEP
jgi:hypothetical protein